MQSCTISTPTTIRRNILRPFYFLLIMNNLIRNFDSFQFLVQASIWMQSVHFLNLVCEYSFIFQSFWLWLLWIIGMTSTHFAGTKPPGKRCRSIEKLSKNHFFVSSQLTLSIWILFNEFLSLSPLPHPLFSFPLILFIFDRINIKKRFRI